MTLPASILLGLTLGFAAGDWVAVARRRKTLEYVCKPATIVALLGVALTIDATDPEMRVFFAAALLFSLAGDVFLMLPSDEFAAGLGFFLLAHIAYIAGLRLEVSSFLAFFVSAAVVAGAVLAVGPRIVNGVRTTAASLRVPVVAYMGVIAAMAAAAGATLDPLAAIGAALFVTSDALIAWNRFVERLAWAPVAIIVSYHLAQVGLILSLAT